MTIRKSTTRSIAFGRGPFVASFNYTPANGDLDKQFIKGTGVTLTVEPSTCCKRESSGREPGCRRVGSSDCLRYEPRFSVYVFGLQLCAEAISGGKSLSLNSFVWCRRRSTQKPPPCTCKYTSIPKNRSSIIWESWPQSSRYNSHQRNKVALSKTADDETRGRRIAR